MDNVTIDLGAETEVEPGAEAVLIGAQGDERILCRGARRAARDDQLRDHLRDLGAGAARARRAAMSPVADGAARRARGRGRRARRSSRRRERLDRRRRGPRRARRRARSSTSTSRSRGDRGRGARGGSPSGAGGPRVRALGRVRDLAGAGRATASWHVDVSRPARRRRSSADLGQRDFTVNAIAVPLADPGAEPIDPHGGARRPRGAAAARGLGAQLRRRPAADPARRPARRRARLRARARGPCGSPGPRPRAPASPAGERQFAELRLLVAGPDPLRGLRAARRARRDRGGAARARPACAAWRRTPTTTSTSTATRSRCSPTCSRSSATSSATPARRPPTSRALLAEPLADELSRGEALRFGAILHDIGKPATRQEHERRLRLLRRPRPRGRGDRARGLRAAEDEPGALPPPRGAHPPPPAPRLHEPRAPALAAPALRLPAADRAGGRRRHPAHRRRPARRPRQRPDRDARR